MKYKSERYFKLWFYSVSHSSILSRSEIQYQDVEYKNRYSPNCTIDIEFFGVVYVDIVTDFEQITLSTVKNIKSKKIMTIANEKELKIFKLASSKGVNYIVAAGCTVGKSMWTNEDRLHNLQLNYEEIVFKL